MDIPLYDDDEAGDDERHFLDLDTVEQDQVIGLQSRMDEILRIEEEDQRLAAAKALVAEMEGAG